jgi:hypothetical protein
MGGQSMLSAEPAHPTAEAVPDDTDVERPAGERIQPELCCGARTRAIRRSGSICTPRMPRVHSRIVPSSDVIAVGFFPMTDCDCGEGRCARTALSP